ncbi:MAG: AraC family transcriptional regulator [Kiritimatiellae bacterium]|nr:AraC family transcriptional regulator [Kiritimatiellia bacterium]
MAKRLIWGGEGAGRAPLQCILLNAIVCPRAPCRRAPGHSHSFWQIEAMVGGKPGLRIGAQGEEFTPQRGELIVIPPGVQHWLEHPAHGSYTATFKFILHGFTGEATTRILPRTDRTRALLGAVTRLLPERAIPGPLDTSLLEHLVAACMQIYAGMAKRGIDPARDPLAERVKRHVADQRGKPVTIRQIAADLGYSTSHLSVQFHRSEGITLKAYLDWQRANAAARLLRYADLRINEIAYHMGFSDPFTFSRFCRRMLGMGPKMFRAQLR